MYQKIAREKKLINLTEEPQFQIIPRNASMTLIYPNNQPAHHEASDEIGCKILNNSIHFIKYFNRHYKHHRHFISSRHKICYDDMVHKRPPPPWIQFCTAHISPKRPHAQPLSSSVCCLYRVIFYFLLALEPDKSMSTT